MTVAQLIDKLLQLPPELEVYHNWEGELLPTKVAEEATAKRYSANGSWSVDYYPECELDEEEERRQVCFVGSSTCKL